MQRMVISLKISQIILMRRHRDDILNTEISLFVFEGKGAVTGQ